MGLVGKTNTLNPPGFYYSLFIGHQQPLKESCFHHPPKVTSRIARFSDYQTPLAGGKFGRMESDLRRKILPKVPPHEISELQNLRRNLPENYRLETEHAPLEKETDLQTKQFWDSMLVFWGGQFTLLFIREFQH